MGIQQSAVQKSDKNINSSDKNIDSSQSSFDPSNNNSSAKDFTDPLDKGSNGGKVKNKTDIFSPLPASDVSTKNIVELSEGNAIVDEGLSRERFEKEIKKLMKLEEDFKNLEQAHAVLRFQVFGLVSLIMGAIAGAAQVGFVTGAIFSKYGARDEQHAFYRLVTKYSVRSSLHFGVWYCSYSYAKPQLKSFRKQDDLLNTFGGAFAAGVISSFRSRSLTRFIANGLISGVAMTFVDYVRMPNKKATL